MEEIERLYKIFNFYLIIAKQFECEAVLNAETGRVYYRGSKTNLARLLTYIDMEVRNDNPGQDH